MANVLTIYEVCCLTRVPEATVRRLVRLGIVQAHEQGSTLHFVPESVRRIGKIMRLRHDLGVNFHAAELVLDLVQRIEALEGRLEFFADDEDS